MTGIAFAGWELALLPALGGAIGTLRHDGADVLRATAHDAAVPLDCACFPLLPYANRIADGRFAFDGRTIALPRNFGDHPHSLHGVGWQSAWQIADVGAQHVRLTHRHETGVDWPWSYRAEQMFCLDNDGLSVSLTLTNLADTKMPAGLGFHPYFPRRSGTRLRFDAARSWLGDDMMLPTEPALADHFADWGNGAALGEAGFVDNAYEDWAGTAVLDSPDRRIRLTAHGARDLHVYLPDNSDFFCVEPVTHLPDAFNRAGRRFDVLPPGGRLSLTMRIALD